MDEEENIFHKDKEDEEGVDGCEERKKYWRKGRGSLIVNMEDEVEFREGL